MMSAALAGFRPAVRCRVGPALGVGLVWACGWLAPLVSLGQTTIGAGADRVLNDAIGEYRTALETPERDERLERFQRAELLFSRLLAVDAVSIPQAGAVERSRIRNPELYVSLGNAALGAEHLGRAIWAYRQALVIDPNHPRARQNLNHARTLLPDWVPQPEGRGWLDSLSAGLTGWSAIDKRTAAACLFLMAMALMSAAVRWRWPVARNLAWLAAGLWVLLLGAQWATSLDESASSAVIIEPDVIARAADSAHAPARLSQPLPAGTEVEIVDQREGWTQIRLADGRDAWIVSSSLDRVP